MSSTKPHRYAGGGHCIFSPITSSFGIPFKTGVSVGRRETLAVAIKLIGVGIDLIDGIVVAIWISRDAYRIAPLKSIVTGARSSSEWSLASDCSDMEDGRMDGR